MTIRTDTTLSVRQDRRLILDEFVDAGIGKQLAHLRRMPRLRRLELQPRRAQTHTTSRRLFEVNHSGSMPT